MYCSTKPSYVLGTAYQILRLDQVLQQHHTKLQVLNFVNSVTFGIPRWGQSKSCLTIIGQIFRKVSVFKQYHAPVVAFLGTAMI